MLPTKRILTVTLMLCTASQAVKENIYSMEFFVNNTDYFLMSPRIAYGDNSFLYMPCQETSRNYHSCNVTLEMPDGNRKQCNIRHDLAMYMTIQRMGDKSMFLSMTQDKVNGTVHTFGKLSLINMDNCTETPLEFPNLISPIYELIVFNDSFVVHVDSNEICGDFASCLINYNYNGEPVGDPVEFALKYRITHSTPVNSFHPEKGVYFLGFIVNPFDSMMKVTHVSTEGDVTNFFNFPYREYKSSHEYDLFTACYQIYLEDGNAVRCLQYNITGENVMNTTVELERNYWMADVFNLRQGGIVILYRNFDGVPDVKLHVKTVHPDGYVMKHVEVPELEYECRSPLYYTSDVDHMETEDEHCFYYACTHNEHNGNISFKYVRKCLDKKTYFLI